MSNWIIKAYVWFWRDFLCRTEQFTDQFRRMAKKYPVIWIIFPALLIVVYFAKVSGKNPKWLWLTIGFLIVCFFTWLLIHLGGFI
jgi:hypothetical protein